MTYKISYCLYFLFLTFFIPSLGCAQTSEQKALEAKREQLQEEIKEINRLLFAERKGKGVYFRPNGGIG